MFIRTYYLRVYGLGLALLGCTVIPFSNAASSKGTRPNMVVFLADDAGFNDVGFQGSEIQTPHMDRLAAEGLILRKHYVYPVCSPTRAALLTGRPPTRFGIYGPLQLYSGRPFAEGLQMLPSLLQEANYETAICGKWHLGMQANEIPNRFGFDHSYGYLGPWLDSYSHLLTDVRGDQSGVRQWHRNGQLLDEHGHVTDLITAEAVRFITDLRDESKPFFLYVAYSAPHTPIQEPRKYTDLYLNSIENESRRYFAAAMTHMDDSIGEIVEALKKEEVDENTILLFFSDNGAAIGRDYSGGGKGWLIPPVEYNMAYGPTDQLGDNTPLRGWKGSLYEGGIRVPAFVRWPAALEPGVCEEVIYVCDWLPTFSGLAGVTVPTDMNTEGQDIFSRLQGDAAPDDRILYWRSSRQQAVRQGPWKLVHTGRKPGEGEFELFNLENDPLESQNLADGFPERVKSLSRELERQMGSDLEPGAR